MKRLIVFSVVAMLLLSISLSHMAFAQRPPRVSVCHVITARTLSNGNTVVIGHIVEVPAPLVPAHLGHGDKLAPGTTQGSCCAFCTTIEGDSCPIRID